MIARARGVLWRHVLLATLFMVACAACDKDGLKESERTEIDRVLQTGVGFEDDAYVRAETMRILEMLADPQLDPLARRGVEDNSPMVSVAAHRALLATHNAEAERLVLATYSKATPDTRLALIDAAMDLGSSALTDELFERAMRARDARLRAIALHEGLLAKVDEAAAGQNEDALRQDLIPRLSQLVDSDDLTIAAPVLGRMVELDRADRAEPLIARFADESTPTDRRVMLAYVLGLAGVTEAKPHFDRIIEIMDQATTQDKSPRRGAKLKLPDKLPAPELVRASVLGAVALGDESLVKRAQAYLSESNELETLQVLEALARNPSEEASISLKIAMTDARARVRRAAIDLYGKRPEAEAGALIKALRQDDPKARRHLANILVARFPDEWGLDLRLQLRAAEKQASALRLLRDVIDTKQDRAILETLREDLTRIVESQSTGSDQEPSNRERGVNANAATAAYLLLLSAPDDPTYLTLLRDTQDVQTRYVFLEHLVRNAPQNSTQIFRHYFYDDLYAMRLMSAAGLWSAYRDGAPASKEPIDEVAASPSDG